MAETLSRPDLLPDLVRHLDQSGELAAISAVLATVPSPNSCFNDSYSSSGSTLATAAPQLVFRPKISVAEVANTNTDLARLAMEEPDSFNRLLQMVILKLARQQEVGLMANQLVVVPRLASLLPFYEHEVTAGRYLGGLRASPRLWSLRRAVLVAISEKVKYVSSAAYRCTGEDCGWGGEESVYVKVFGPVGGGGLPRAQECLGCGAPMEEQIHRRDVSERVTGRVVTATSSVTAVFRQEEAALLHLGGEYELVFTLVHERDGADRRVMVEVCGLEPLVPPLHRRAQLSHQPLLPPSLQALHHQHAASPWALVTALACLLGRPATAPTLPLLNLRLALLLSLATSGKERLHLLVLGPDLVFAHRLLHDALALAPRYALHSHLLPLGGTLAKDTTGVKCVQAGALHRAQGGVVYLGELAALAPATRQQVVSSLDTATVPCPTLPRSPPTTEPLTTAVWGLAEGASSALHRTIKNIQSFYNVFGLVAHVEVKDEEVVRHCLLAEDTTPALPSEELAALVEQVRHRAVTLSTACRRLLRGYYLASRRIRGGVGIPQSAIGALLLMATAHTKLAMRTEGEEEDAALACLMLESSLAAAPGGQAMVELPPAPTSMVHLHTRDMELRGFLERIKQFVANYGPGDKGEEEEGWPEE